MHVLVLSVVHVSACVICYDILFRILICQTMLIAVVDERPQNVSAKHKEIKPGNESKRFQSRTRLHDMISS